MNEFTLWDIVRNLLYAVPWTLLLSAIAFAGGGFVALILLVIGLGSNKTVRVAVKLYVELFQSTPLLMQLFLVYFGLPLLGIDVSAWLAAGSCLTLYSSAFLTDIWRGSVEAIPKGQWEGSSSLGLHYLAQLRLVILPQATRMAIPPTVGFLVQLIKNTSLAAVIGFIELTREGQLTTATTFRPFTVYLIVAAIYFALCFPLTQWSRRLERRLHVAR